MAEIYNDILKVQIGRVKASVKADNYFRWPAKIQFKLTLKPDGGRLRNGRRRTEAVAR